MYSPALQLGQVNMYIQVKWATSLGHAGQGVYDTLYYSSHKYCIVQNFGIEKTLVNSANRRNSSSFLPTFPIKHMVPVVVMQFVS